MELEKWQKFRFDENDSVSIWHREGIKRIKEAVYSEIYKESDPLPGRQHA